MAHKPNPKYFPPEHSAREYVAKIRALHAEIAQLRAQLDELKNKRESEDIIDDTSKS